jgi:ribosomal protein S18 acetylase RimI-like enzyme
MTIRQVAEKDFPVIIEMLKEFAVFQKTPVEKVINTVELMKEERAYFNCFVAETAEGEIAGMASYSFIYFTWSGKSIYLDDLYVKPIYRGQKIGKLLLDKIFETAKAAKCQRVRWLVSDWNTPAIEFYKKIGATMDEEVFLCDVDKKGIENYLSVVG